MKKCPACEKNIPAYKTVVGEVNLLCETHLDQLEGSLHNIIESHEPVARGADTSAKPNTESDKSIDEWFILVEANRDVSARTWTEETLPYLKSNLYSLLMDVIGENEYVDGMIGDDKLMTQHADNLRQTQRQKLNQLFKEIE